MQKPSDGEHFPTIVIKLSVNGTASAHSLPSEICLGKQLELVRLLPLSDKEEEKEGVREEIRTVFRAKVE